MTPCWGAVNVIPLLHGPLPDALPVTTHHTPAPEASTTLGVSEHVPVPLAQPACAAVYVVLMRPPELSSTHRRYCVAPATAFHVYVGVLVAMLPEGATRVAAGGGGVPATVNVSPLLQGPLPDALEVTTHHWPAPGFSTRPGASEHVPVRRPPRASLGPYAARLRPPELSSTQRRYCVAPATAFQVKVGVAVAMLPEGATRVAAGGGGVPATVNAITLLHGPLPDALDVTIHHCPAPGFSTTPGAIAQVPMPLAQPVCAAV